MSVTFDTRELKAFQLTIQRMGGIPTKVATKAASKGATVVRREVRSRIPVGETGELKRGIKRKGERSKFKGKKVYDLMFDPAKNAVFQKPVKHPGEAGSTSTKGGHAYYPASQQYGFLTRSKGGGIRYVAGKNFMGEGAETAAVMQRKTVIDTAVKELESEWLKK